VRRRDNSILRGTRTELDGTKKSFVLHDR
jgi:hypothetical protein